MRVHSIVYDELAKVGRQGWDQGFSGNSGLSYDFLSVVEASKINRLQHSYVQLRDENERNVGRANLYQVAMDFATMDRALPLAARQVVKQWYPDLMNFQLLECGQFTMIGEAVQAAPEADVRDVLSATFDRMEEIGQASGIDFFLVRDVPLANYELYLSLLKPRGYLPACGFANAYLENEWTSFDAFLAAQDSKTRYKLKSSLEVQAKLGIEVEIVTDFSQLSAELERLWLNVNNAAGEYSRERLNKEFFERASRVLGAGSEIILFKHAGRPIAFMLNLIGEHDYIMLDWGVDYQFEHYRQANLYRAASVYCVKRTIELGKRRLEMGITNYVPKALLGGKVEPLAYFVKHSKEPWKTRTLAKLISDSVQQPVELSWPRAEDQISESPGAHWRTLVRRDQSLRSEFDIFARAEQNQKFDALRLSGLYALYPVFTSAQKQRVQYESSQMILIGTNCYLGLATDPRVISATEAALRRYGTGCSGSPLLNGTLDLHVELEQSLSRFVAKEAAMICSTGYQTNLTALSALCGPGDLIVMDARNHRSLFDGAKLSGAEYVVYGHRDVAQLRRVLERRRGRRTLVVTDSVFSMEGTVAPLAQICDVCEEFGARLYVDESHAFGVAGPNGRGMAEQAGVLDRVDLVMGTFSKSLAAVGGFVAGRADIIDFMKHNGGGHVFSASLPPPVVAAVLKALEIIEREPELRASVLEKAGYAARRLCEMGYRAEFHGVPIVPVVFGNTTLAVAAYKQFMQAGVYVNPVGPPAVPEDRAGFRTSYMASHSWSDIDDAMDVFEHYRGDFAAFLDSPRETYPKLAQSA